MVSTITHQFYKGFNEHSPEFLPDLFGNFNVDVTFEKEVIELYEEIEPTTENNTSIKLKDKNQNVKWCIRTGREKLQPFWAYCEEAQDNFIKFTLNIPNFSISSHSKIVKDLNGELMIIENDEEILTQAVYFKGLNSTNLPLYVNQNSYTLIPDNEFSFKVNLIKDDEEPVHPHQGEANIVHIKTQVLDSNHKSTLELPFPLNLMCKINFRGRSQGWFKLECSLQCNDITFYTVNSDTFMMNNPRMKKMAEHKLYPCCQLKFMQLYALDLFRNIDHDKSKWENLGTKLRYGNLHELFNQAPKLFPKIVRSRTNLGKRKRPNWK